MWVRSSDRASPWQQTWRASFAFIPITFIPSMTDAFSIVRYDERVCSNTGHLTVVYLVFQASLVHKAMITVLKIALRFRQCWERGVAHFDIREAEDMEVEFLRSCIFLVTCLNKAVQRGSSPHCKCPYPSLTTPINSSPFLTSLPHLSTLPFP